MQHTDIKYPSLLATLFSNSFIQKVIDNQHIPYVKTVLSETGLEKLLQKDLTVSKVLNKAFDYLNTHYRCEYVYKTAVLNEVLLKRHSFFDSTYLTEFRAFNTKADILILNGTSTVYEIKSDIDRFNRLINQLITYQKIFDKVFVVTNEQWVSKVKKMIPPRVGVISLQEDLTIDTHLEAKSNLRYINKGLMFDSLRKAEYLSIIETHFGSIPKVPTTLIHSACRKLFCTLTNTQAHRHFVSRLKTRQLSGSQIKYIEQSPKGLKGLLTEKFYSEKDCELIKFGLKQSISN